MRLYTLELPANESQLVAVSGTYFRLLTAKERITVLFSNGYETELLPGIGVKTELFNNFFITSTTAQTVEVMAGQGEVFDSRVVGMVNLGGAAEVSDPASVTVGVGATLVKAKNTRRRSLLMQAIDGDIYYGSKISVTINDGIQVKAGQSVEVTNTADVYAIASANVDVRVQEESNV